MVYDIFYNYSNYDEIEITKIIILTLSLLLGVVIFMNEKRSIKKK